MMTREFTGKHMFLTMLAFFGVIIVANAVFLTYAISSFPGETQSKSYVRGLKYNDVLAEKRRQQALGWRVEVIRVSGEGDIELRVEDSSQKGLAGLRVSGVAKRPAYEGDDQPIAFREVGDGVYRAENSALTNGVWDIVAQAESERGDMFDFTSRIVIR